jgi:hypothetical protein
MRAHVENSWDGAERRDLAFPTWFLLFNKRFIQKPLLDLSRLSSSVSASELHSPVSKPFRKESAEPVTAFWRRKASVLHFTWQRKTDSCLNPLSV